MPVTCFTQQKIMSYPIVFLCFTGDLNKRKDGTTGALFKCSRIWFGVIASYVLFPFICFKTSNTPRGRISDFSHGEEFHTLARFPLFSSLLSED